jgi:MoxR-like ATPase
VSNINLRDEAPLRAALAFIDSETAPAEHWVHSWRAEIVKFLKWIAGASPDERASREFQKKLWDDNPITGVGMGTVKVDVVLDDPVFRSWMAGLAGEQLPSDVATRGARLNEIHRDLLKRFEKRTNRLPRLKICRTLAALFPDDFTTISHRTRLGELHDRMLSGGGTVVDQHLQIMRRLEEVMGPAGSSIEDRVARMTLPWMLFKFMVQGEEETETEVTTTGGETKLVPLPAARRRRGLTAIAGYFQTVRNMLQAIEPGITREELLDFLRTLNPTFKDSSHGTTINLLSGEYGVVQRDGDTYRLTSAGKAVLETGDPDELAERLMTRILGFDHGLVHLRDHAPCSSRDLQLAIQKANPGWTSLYSPSSMVAWFKSLGLVEPVHGDKLQLSERGNAWTAQIHWVPECLVQDEAVTEATILEEPAVLATTEIVLPSIEDIHAHVSQGNHFPKKLVAELHAGLWSQPRRHFAILTGISGSGKTLLARRYGEAIVGGSEQARRRLLPIAVQPGWYDPGPILGYVNPIRPDSYVRTPFLEFLFAALREPGRPYVVLFDEMNLSRPEQYLAPLLSAMETAGGELHLHREQEGFDGVSRNVPYPNNLVVLGTVNMDETTHGLSDKVLDRAFTFEFWDIDVASFPGWKDTRLVPEEKEKTQRVLTSLASALSPARLHFGWRVIDEVVKYLERTKDQGVLGFPEALDSAVFAKVLPKVRGDDSKRFQDALKAAKAVAGKEGLTRCLAKLDELESDLLVMGSARFWR